MMTTMLVAAAQGVADTVSGMNPVLTEISGEPQMNLWDMACKGGWIMIVLALMSVIACYIFFERAITIRKAINTGEVKSAINYCRMTNTPAARMIEKGISRMDRPVADVQAAIENTGNIEVAKLENGLSIIATVSSGAPMLGFLGTVTGMVRAFWNMANAGNNIDITLLSSGIYEAMIAMFAYNHLVYRVDKVVSQMEARTMAFMDLLNESKDK